ncbi:hypothetical protein AAMO2058_000169800 [Amorphochlora amoebiformis]
MDVVLHNYNVGHALEVKNNPFAGISLGGWCRIVWKYGYYFQWGKYWLRIIFLTFMAFINTFFGFLDWVIFAGSIAKAIVNPNPVFVLGHPRTGTTLLHNLLSLDNKQFIFCSTFQAGFPSGFAILRPISWMFAAFVDSKRPMDNMELSLDLPQEDELATNALSGGASQYMSIYLPQLERKCFRPLIAFDEKEACPRDSQAWRSAFDHLMRKLSAVNDNGSGRRRLLLKSPVHTGRVRLLLKLFPNAQFIYLHRDPYRVYQSAVNMADKAYPYMYLHTPSDMQMQDFILDQFLLLHRLYIRDRDLIPKGNLVELSFAELTKDPIKAVEGIYRSFGWKGFEFILPKIQQYQAKHRSYSKNTFVGLSEIERKVISRKWREAFEEFGYKL